MGQTIESSGYFAFSICALAYITGCLINRRTKTVLLNPMLISVAIVGAILFLFNIDYDTFNDSAKYLNWFMTPATVCFAIPLYEQLQTLKSYHRAVILGIGAGVLTSIGSIIILSMIFRMSHTQMYTLLPKSVTTAIGMEISRETGGNPSITAAVIVITGIFGNIFAQLFLKVFGVKNRVAKGVAIGTAAHVMGTAKAMELGDIEGAMSSLSIVIAGIMTVISVNILSLFI